MNIFISGSISVKFLPKIAMTKIDNIIKKNMNILIGDAKGVDLLVQKYLAKKQYNNVTVYFSGEKYRNNIGNWSTKNIKTNTFRKSRELYTLKDEAMSKDSDYGLMIWDGESKGTLNNIQNMKILNKKFFVILGNIIIQDKNIDSLISLKNKTIQQLELDFF